MAAAVVIRKFPHKDSKHVAAIVVECQCGSRHYIESKDFEATHCPITGRSITLNPGGEEHGT